MKNPKKLNYSMKKLVSSYGHNPNDYWYIKNTNEYLEVVNKNDTKKRMKLYK